MYHSARLIEHWSVTSVLLRTGSGSYNTIGNNNNISSFMVKGNICLNNVFNIDALNWWIYYL